MTHSAWSKPEIVTLLDFKGNPRGSTRFYLRKLARNKLVAGFMDTMMWEILAGILIFAAANMVYFEIRRLIQFLRGDFKKSKSLPNQQDSTVGPAV